MIEDMKGEFLRVYKIEVFKTIIILFALVFMVLAGGVLVQARISTDNKTKEQYAIVLKELDDKIQDEREYMMRRDKLLAEFTRQQDEQTKYFTTRVDRLQTLCERIIKNQEKK